MDEGMKERTRKANKNIAEVAVALAEDKGDNMTLNELADLLDVKRNADGGIPGVELFNACLIVSDNPAVKVLPRPERLRAIRSAIYTMENLLAGEAA